MINNYKNLEVWEMGVQLVAQVYEVTRGFPKEEQYGLVSQMRRSAVSIPSNIAEGKMRDGDKEFKRFLYIALGSGAELETQIEIAKVLPETKMLEYDKLEGMLGQIMRMLNSLIRKLDASS